MELEHVPYGVYARLDELGRIVTINSDVFLQSLDGWVKIDEGYGDAFHHAQGNYLPKGLMNENGVCRYKLVDGEPVERSIEEMDADLVEPENKLSNNDRLTALEEQILMILSGVTSDE